MRWVQDGHTQPHTQCDGSELLLMIRGAIKDRRWMDGVACVRVAGLVALRGVGVPGVRGERVELSVRRAPWAWPCERGVPVRAAGRGLGARGGSAALDGTMDGTVLYKSQVLVKLTHN